MEHFEQIGNLPVRNFRDGSFPGVTKITAQAVKETIGVGMHGCHGCPVRCKKVVRVDEPYLVDPAYGGPEYETLASLGSNCGIDDLKAVAKGNELCNAYSLDTISVGSVVAFAMECFENGLLTAKDTDGIDLRFGNAEAMIALIEAIAKREGIGDLLAEGTARAAERIGGNAAMFAMQVKGLDLAMHEPRLKPGLGLGYMVNPHGADHCDNMHDVFFVTKEQIAGLHPMGILEPVPAEDIGPRKVALFKLTQLKAIIGDCLLACLFMPYSAGQLAEATTAATGWNTGVVDQYYAAERILTLARLFNAREGFTAEDDRLPERFFQPTTDGAMAATSLDPGLMDSAKRYYYSLMGWDRETGLPTKERIEELGLV
jgi:aldehyde:ferredoxin oxidoreductase